MAAQGTSAQEGLPLHQLSAEQLSGLQKQVEQEVNFFTASATALQTLLSKVDKSTGALKNLENAQPGQESLIPLSESLYVRAELTEPSRHLVEIGTGYFVEMEREKAIALFERKKAHVVSQLETIEKIMVEKRRTRAIISDAFQQKVQQQVAAMKSK